MIVVDSSALIAIFFNEPERQAFEAVITGGDPCLISAVNAHETASVPRARPGSATVGSLNSPHQTPPSFYTLQARRVTVWHPRRSKWTNLST